MKVLSLYKLDAYVYLDKGNRIYIVVPHYPDKDNKIFSFLKLSSKNGVLSVIIVYHLKMMILMLVSTKIKLISL